MAERKASKPQASATDRPRRRAPIAVGQTSVQGEYELTCGRAYGKPHWEADKDDYPGGVRSATIAVHASRVCNEKTTFKVTTARDAKEYDVNEDNTRAVTRRDVKSVHIKCDAAAAIDPRDHCYGTWTVTIEG